MNRPTKHYLILLLIAGAMSTVFALTQNLASADLTNLLATPTPADPLASEILLLEENLKSAGVDEEMKNGLERKIEILHAEQTREVLAGDRTPSPPTALELTPPASNLGTRPTGILDEVPMPPRGNFAVENAWQNQVDGVYVVVGAGYLLDDPDQGAIFYDTPTVFGPHVVVKTPKKSGAVKIVEVQGSNLVLTSAGGDTFIFDVPGRRFVTSLNEVPPTITPYNTPTSRARSTASILPLTPSLP